MITRSIPEIGYLGRDVHEAFGFAQLVRTGPFVHISGVAPVIGPLADLRLIGNTAAEQLEFIFVTMRRLLETEGLGLEALASWTIYCTDTPAVVAALPGLVGKFVGEHRPASTLLGVTALFLPGQLVEIAAIAYSE